MAGARILKPYTQDRSLARQNELLPVLVEGKGLGLSPIPQHRNQAPQNQDSIDIDLRHGIDEGAALTAKGRLKRNREDENDVDDDDHEHGSRNCGSASDSTNAQAVVHVSYKDPKFPFKQASYHIRRGYDLYGNIHRIMNDGIKREARMEAGEEYTNVQTDRDYTTYQNILEHMIGLREEITRLHRNPIEFRMLIRKIKDAADSARNNDTAGLKKDVPLFLTSDGRSPILMTKEPHQSASSKSDRGFENDIIGRFLCPVSQDWDDLEARQKIRDGKVAIVAEDFPRLLYKDCKYNDDDIEDGLGKNTALLRVVKYIMTGRSSAFCETAGGRTTRAGNAAIAGVKTITPNIIAYGACMLEALDTDQLQLRFSLITQESWNKMDGEFNFEDFYWAVVKIFEDSGDFGNELLAWWNRKVLGISDELRAKPKVKTINNSLDKLAAQRAAKRVCVRSPRENNQDASGSDNDALPSTSLSGSAVTPS